MHVINAMNLANNNANEITCIRVQGQGPCHQRWGDCTTHAALCPSPVALYLAIATLHLLAIASLYVSPNLPNVRLCLLLKNDRTEVFFPCPLHLLAPVAT